MAPYKHILFEKERGRARITLNRPEKHNAISMYMQRELHAALWDADEDPAVHATVIKGAGPSFCAGFDLEAARPAAEKLGITPEMVATPLDEIPDSACPTFQRARYKRQRAKAS